MISKIEDALLRCHRANGLFREILFGYLNEARLLRRLRTVSRVFHDIIDGTQAVHMFQELYVDAPLAVSADVENSITDVAPNCRHLTIRVENAHSPSFSNGDTLVNSPTSRFDSSQHCSKASYGIRMLPRDSSSSGSTKQSRVSAETIRPRKPNCKMAASLAQRSTITFQDYDYEKQQRANILSHFINLEALTLRINGDPAWPGLTDVEQMLITLRIAIESTNLKPLKTLCLAPIHAMGIIHLRWSGLGAFGESNALGGSVWQNIHSLDVQMQNPFTTQKLTEAQGLMFKKILYEYLRSFAPTLRCLRFVWLGGDGPSPLTLHLLPDLEGRREIQWPKLEELWVGNIILPRRMIRLTPQHAPNVTRLKILRSTRRDSSIDPSDSSAWVEVMGLGNPIQDDETDMASSIYSRGSRSEESLLAGGISRTSRDLQFFLDI